MRKLGALAVLLLYATALLSILATPAAAEIEGPCTASFNGIHFDDIDTPGEARKRLVIQPGESVTFYAAVPDTDAVYVDILFPPLTITLFEGEAEEPSEQGSDINEVEGELELGAFAEYGSGIFQFVGRTDDCWGNAYFIIGGVDPWETVVGRTAIGITAVGVVVALTSWVPAILAGGGGVIRSVVSGGPIGVGAAVLLQQAGMVPLSATSVGVAVGGSSIASVVISKGLVAIHGAGAGGAAPGSVLTPAAVSPPPTPAATPTPPAHVPVAEATLTTPATAPTSTGSPPASASPGTTGTATPPTPEGAGVPTAPETAATGSGKGLASGAAAGAAALGATSRAAAAQKRATAGSSAVDPHWFYVTAPTEMYGLDNYDDVIGQVEPGSWYEAKAIYDDWVHAVDQSTGREGWVAKDAVNRHNA